MPILKMKLIAANTKTTFDAAVTAYLAGLGSDALTAVRAVRMKTRKMPQGATRFAGLIVHGGLDLPAGGSKTADVQFLVVDKGSVADAQTDIDTALANAVHDTVATGDTSVAGTVTVDEATFFESEDVGRQIQIGNEKRTITAVTVPVAATGTITVVGGADLIDGETFVLDDGVNAPVTFEFDDDASVTPSATLVAVDFTGADSVATVKAAVIAAITGALDITPTDGGGAIVNLVNDLPGTVGNAVITNTVADVDFTHTGMSGGLGVDGESSVTYSGVDFDADTGLTVKLLGAECLQDVGFDVFKHNDLSDRFGIVAAVGGEQA